MGGGHVCRRKLHLTVGQFPQSADSQASGEPSGRTLGQAAYEDIERGVVDTDKGPVLDQTYDKVREGADDPVKKFSP